MSSKKKMQYDAASVESFQNFFHKPKKRGRPKKKKRGRPKSKKKKTSKAKAKQIPIVDLTGKTLVDLSVASATALKARLAGVMLNDAKTTHRRVNWDVKENFERRQRYADSWTKKIDLFRAGESFQNFCDRCGIDRNVLRRYIAGKYSQQVVGMTKPRGRGKPSLLPESVMRHLCEGLFVCAYMH